MASLVPGAKKPGRVPRRVDFTLRGEKKRRHVRLGKMGFGRAEKIRQGVVSLVECQAHSEPPTMALLEWIYSLPAKLTRSSLSSRATMLE